MPPKDTEQPECLAVIGMAGRFPGASSMDQFWRNLCEGKEFVTTFTDAQLLAAGEEPSLLQSPNYVKAGILLENMDSFDAEFFGITPREAEMTDPQHRMFLECAWEALEDAGYDPDETSLRIGVFAGTGTNNYFAYGLMANPDLMKSWNDFQRMIAIDNDYLTTRVSYKLNLKGPSIAVQTACSTSLVSVHLACQSLLNGECDIALAGGVFIKIPHVAGYMWEQGSILSPEGRCRAFDAKAKGTMFGSGAGIVVLKRATDALDDGDCIRALVRGSSINNDGSLKIGFTAPSVEGQAAVIAEAHAVAGVTGGEITYVEAHGTGTSLGDPIEVAALTKAFRRTTQGRNFCAIGSLKTNIGHLDTAAGIAGLIKTVLALEHKVIPPSLNFEQPNPGIDFVSSPFYVNTKLQQWKAGPTQRRAGVSSFGFGGTNAHVVIEEAPVLPTTGSNRDWQLILLSARTSNALEATTKNLAAVLERHPDLNIHDLAYTLQVGRRRFKHRRILICEGGGDALETLETKDSGRLLTSAEDHADIPIAFMFTGQGSQYVNMALELYQVETLFREEVDHLCDMFEPLLGLDLRTLLFPPLERAAEATQQLTQTQFSQGALFTIEYALARMWMAWGVTPNAMIGHSLGEYVAATLSGVFSVESAVALVAERSRLMQSLPTGSMLAVPMPESEIRPLLNGHISLAAVNGPRMCVVSGTTGAVETLHNRLMANGTTSTMLHTSHAFHSAMMEPILENFALRVSNEKRNPPQVPFISNVTGTWITEAEATDPQYWATHLRNTVRFADGIKKLLTESAGALLELGPGNTLCSLAKDQAKPSAQRTILPTLRRPQEQRSDLAFLLNTLGRLWVFGVTIDWAGFYAAEKRRRVPLPTYPFERRRFWITSKKKSPRESKRAGTPHKRADISEWFYAPCWKQSAWTKDLGQKTNSTPRICLFLLDECGLGIQLAERMKRNGHEVICVTPGQQFDRINDDHFAVAPGYSESYSALLNELHASSQLPDLIVHLGSVAADQAPGDSLAEAKERGFYSLLFLTQALETCRARHTPEIAVISTGLHNITGEEILHPERAIILGPCKVIPQEYPGTYCRNIDIVLPKAGSHETELLLDQLEQELMSSRKDPVVGYRRERRWVQTFEHLRLHVPDNVPKLLRDGGVYLITGGLGTIGLDLAQWLAKAFGAKLILTSRTPFPPKNSWHHWLETHAIEDATSRSIRKLQTIEITGGEVLVVRGDASDESGTRAVIDEVYAQFGALHGVIHAAGLDRSHLIHELSRVECEAVLLPKVQGLSCLEQALRGRSIDFCMLMSSLSAVLGGLGFAAYCGANIFMDVFASQQNKTSTFPWITIDWDRWVPGETAEGKPVLKSTLAALGLNVDEGIEAFHRALSARPLNHLVISTADLQARINQWVRLDESGIDKSEQETKDVPPEKSVDLETSEEDGERPAEAGATILYPRPTLSSAYIEPGNMVERTIAECWQRLLGIDKVGIDDNFFELGGDSLMAIQAVSLLNKGLSSPIHIVTFYDSPTIRLLAETLTGSKSAQADMSQSEGRAMNRREFAERRAKSKKLQTKMEER